MAIRLPAAAFAAFLALPAAHAAAATGGCRFQGVSAYESITGSNPETVTGLLTAYGGDLQATVTCEIRVDGQTAVSLVTDGGSRTERATFSARVSQAVELCGTLDTPFGSDSSCVDMRSTEAPPREVADALLPLLTSIDAIACPVLASLPHPVGVVEIEPDGDVRVADGTVYDCPPYGSGGAWEVRVTYWDAEVTLNA